VTADRSLAFDLWWHDHPELSARVSASAGVPIPLAPVPGAERYRLGLTLDRVPSLSFSLYAFRRSPWPWTLAPVEIALPPQPPDCWKDNRGNADPTEIPVSTTSDD